MEMMKMSSSRIVAFGTLGALALGSAPMLSTPANAAGSKTWKKAAIGGAAVTGYGLLRHKGKVATLGAVATAGSYYMYKKKKKKEEQQRRYHRRYRRR